MNCPYCAHLMIEDNITDFHVFLKCKRCRATRKMTRWGNDRVGYPKVIQDWFDFFYPPLHEDFRMDFWPQLPKAHLICANNFHHKPAQLIHTFRHLPDLNPYNIIDKMPLLLTFS